MIHVKKIIFLVILLLFQSSFTANAITASEAIAQSKQITRPNGIKSPNSYGISTSTVREAQTSVPVKKLNFVEISSGGETTSVKTINLKPTSTWICALSKASGFYGRGLKGLDAQVFQSGGWWKLRSGRAGCGGCALATKAICWTR